MKILKWILVFLAGIGLSFEMGPGKLEGGDYGLPTNSENI
jgi:hypothetical protein